ncbi:FYN-binding protein 1 isoform X2 [Boleophthalmus pectinirostris]|uniref:FYN-binding protein 1 isoform X2 n=1 Tax=Boleophthalmus pectinirostris TaxID=150288 RepID=UPI00242B0599|nr:FYN-binding protein 1 isoform X2 [Boleophthalmus pectinirostris]
MENKPDVKAMMARFQGNASSKEDTPFASPGQPKQPVHATLSGQALHMKKPVSDSGAPIPPKPSFLKNTPSFKSDTVAQEPNKTKALASKFTNSQENTSPPISKHKLPSKSPYIQPISPEPIVPLFKAGVSAAGSEPKPVFLKPVVKPNWIKEDSTSSPPPPAPKIPTVQPKPNNNIFKLQQQIEATALNTKAEVITDPVIKPTFPVIPAVKPTSNTRTAQILVSKEPAEQDACVRPSAANKPPLNISVPPPKPLASKKPSLKKPSPHINNSDSSAPKKNPLPNSLALGPAPAKPNRPPFVNLDAFKGGPKTPADDPKRTIAPPPPFHPSNHSNHVTPPPPPVPSLQSRSIEDKNLTEDFYDDVDGPTSAPPPLPPVHPSQISKEKDEDDDDDGEMYEDLDERWEEQKQDKKKAKDDKEEKKRLEAEKKEQKEREKKEQEARKKFKLVGPVEVLQKGKARVDFKGTKTDLSLKQGDSLDIIRIQGNPEGKWLGRARDGAIGYVKITSVEIDFNALKQQGAGQAYEPEVYDDIDMAPPEKSKAKGPVVALPPLPVDGEEIYDDVDPIVDVRLPPTSQFSGDTVHKEDAIDEDIYDDVDSQNMPPPPMIGIPKVDPKKQKKLEKEEKEFRKKFKYDGEITVLHQVTIIPNLTNKKWSNKELSLKAGEKLDVIVKPVDNKFICRNEDGKFGYVSTSYVATDDGDIYDDIGDDECIYDND